MKILIVTDAWEPQVNGVVRTLKSTRRELERLGHQVELLTPLEFRTLPCPTYPDIRLSLFPGRKVRKRIARLRAAGDPHRHRRPARHRRARLRAAPRPAVHHRVPHALSRSTCTRAPRLPLGGDLPVPALVPWPRARR